MVDKIANLQSDMNPSHRKPLPPIPAMQPEEVPEKQREYTKDSLLKFKEDKAAMDEAERLAAAGLGEGGFFGGFGGGGDEGEGDEGKDKGEEGTEKLTTKDSREVRIENATLSVIFLLVNFCRRLIDQWPKRQWHPTVTRL